MEEVLEQIRLGPNPSIDIDNQFHHVFWFGDLNYRVQLNTLDKKKREINAHIKEVKDMIRAKQWHALYAADQLHQAMAENRMFPGFHEAIPDFPPTFKVERAAGYQYQKKKLRVPSYCDRILWKHMPSRADCLKLRSFTAAPELITSDHKAVMADFDLQCRSHVAVGTGSRDEYPQVLITQLRGHDLLPSDTNQLADPYVVFESDPPNLFNRPKSKPKKTGTVMKNLSPKWSDDDVPALHARVVTKEQLRRCSIVFCVWDWDRISPDDPMGQCAVGFNEIFDNARRTGRGLFKFDVPVSYHGRVKGRLRGNIEVVWPEDARHTSMQAGDAPKPGMGCCTVQ